MKNINGSLITKRVLVQQDTDRELAPAGRNGDFPERFDLLAVAALFAISRALYGSLGLHFDASPFDAYMQFIDRDLLSSRLLESIWYYHANPPLLNLFAGASYKLFGEHVSTWFAGLYHLLGLTLALCVYCLTRRLSNSRWASLIAAGLLVFSPAFVLYENWLMYTFPTVVLVTAASLLLHRYLTNYSAGWGFAFFTTLATLLLLRSLFHLAWLLVMIALLVLVSPAKRKQIGLVAALPVLLVVLWCAKNLYYFGTFGMSTWFGLGFSNITTLVVPRDELQPLVRNGRLSQFALVSRYQQIDQLFTVPASPTDVPVLDQVKKSTGGYNFNNLRVLTMNRYYTADGFTVVQEFPYYYLLGLQLSNKLFFSPPSMNLYFSAQNRAAVRPMEKIFNPALYGAHRNPHWEPAPHFGFNSGSVLEVNFSAPLVVVSCLLLAYAYSQMRGGLISKHRDRPRALVMGFILCTALYIYVVGTAFELAENYRYRYNVEPLMFVLAATAVTDAARRLRARFVGRSNNAAN